MLTKSSFVDEHGERPTFRSNSPLAAPELLVQPGAVALTVNATRLVPVLLVMGVREHTHEDDTKAEKQHHDDQELLLDKVLEDVLPVALSTDQDKVVRSQQHFHTRSCQVLRGEVSDVGLSGVLAKPQRLFRDFLLQPEPLHLEVFQTAASLP